MHYYYFFSCIIIIIIVSCNNLRLNFSVIVFSFLQGLMIK